MTITEKGSRTALRETRELAHPTVLLLQTSRCGDERKRSRTANLRTKIQDFRGFDSSKILIERGGIPCP